jgi:hypothetical protein
VSAAVRSKKIRCIKVQRLAFQKQPRAPFPVCEILNLRFVIFNFPVDGAKKLQTIPPSEIRSSGELPVVNQQFVLGSALPPADPSSQSPGVSSL